MDDEDYKPRSPDLSALPAYAAGAQQQSSYAPSYPYSTGQQSFALPQSSYYDPQPPTSAYTQPAYTLSPHNIPADADHDPRRVKREGFQSPPPGPASAATGKPRKMSKMQQQQQQQLAKSEPRLPAPGDEEHIVIKTKFPVARIKRLVQADDEVGKVAQVTPPVVGKALELFMIQITLAAVAEAQSRGSKRLTAAHIKAAISADVKFDFLKEIGDRIPEGPAPRSEGREKKQKAEKTNSDDDVDMDDHKPVKRKAGARRKKAADDD